MNFTEQIGRPAMFLLIDFATAFDFATDFGFISLQFMSKDLEFFNFDEDIKSWIKNFYNNIQSCVTVNGHLSE
jgi:hypothetical protein